MALGEAGKEEIESAAEGVFGVIEIQGKTSVHKRKEERGRVEEVVERN